jgi:hypothetical protein
MKRQEAGENCITKTSVIFTFHQTLVGRSNRGGRNWLADMYKILVGNSERRRPLGETTLAWEYVIKLDLKEIKVGRHELDSCGSEEPMADS